MFFDAAFSSQGAVSWLGELLPIMKLPIKSWHCIRYWILSFLLLVFDGIFSSAEQYVRRTRRTLMLDGQMDRCECTITDNDDGEIQFSCVLSQEGIVCRNYRWIVRGNCRVDCAKFSMRCRPFLASKLNWNSGIVTVPLSLLDPATLVPGPYWNVWCPISALDSDYWLFQRSMLDIVSIGSIQHLDEDDPLGIYYTIEGFKDGQIARIRKGKTFSR